MEDVTASNEDQLSCRFYENEYPEVDEFVIVLVKNIADMGAYVSLVEYNNIEGMVLLSELSRRRIRSINKLIRVGKMEVCMVMRVDKEKGYIDLSRRRVAAEDIVKCQERFSKGKAVNTIMRNVAETTGTSILELNKKITWPLSRLEYNSGKPERPFTTAHEAFRVAITDPDLVFNQPGVEIEDSTKSQLLKVIKRKLTPQPIKVRADIEVTCFGESGIDGIRQALLAGEKASPEESPVKIRLIAPPLYVMMTTSLSSQVGLSAMEKSIEVLSKVLSEEHGGKVEVKKKPHITSTQEENSLKSLMERMELDNAEVGGDDDEATSD